MLRSLAQIVIFAAMAIAVVVGLFIAWWIAVCAVLGFAAYLWVRRLLGAKMPANHVAGSGPVVIEGQYEVEPEPQSPPRQRVIDVDPGKH